MVDDSKEIPSFNPLERSGVDPEGIIRPVIPKILSLTRSNSFLLSGIFAH